jgi:DNA-binding CsgD family transcriptional regulator
MRSADTLRVVEAAYDDIPDERLWLQNVADAALPLLDDRLGLYAYVYALPPSGLPVRSTFVSAGDMVDGERRQEAIDRESAPEIIRAAFGRSQVSTVSEYHGRPPDEREPGVTRQLVPYGARDAMGLISVDPGGLGLGMTVFLRSPCVVSRPFRERWSRVMAHIGAALRLRRNVAVEEAVLDVSGKLLDATALARGREARLALRHAARAIDRARARRRSAPDEALAHWQALADGRWSLVDRFESGGRHFLVARANPPRPTTSVPSLSEREACVVALAARGRSNKLIAYELGLAVGTVGTLLSRACRKLGVRSRALLVSEWNRLARER